MDIVRTSKKILHDLDIDMDHKFVLINNLDVQLLKLKFIISCQ
jgi:hypothetical protein